MLKRLKSKKSAIYAILAFAITAGVGAYTTIGYASESKVPTDKVKTYISNITHKKYGEVVVKASQFNGKNKMHVIAEDNKYIYKVDETSGKFATIVSKLNEDYTVNGALSKDVANTKAEQYLSQYIPASDNCKYILNKSIEPQGENKNYYDIYFQEVASNGVKTGAFVNIMVNTNGDLIGLANFEGNPTVALTVTPILSRAEAVKIVTDNIKQKPHLKNIKVMPEDNTELSVWQNKLAWVVEISGIIGEGTNNGYRFYIDAVDGTVLDKDGYSALE